MSETPQAPEERGNNKPAAEFFLSSPKGGVKATVWENLYENEESGEKRSFKSVTLRRVYREGEEWKESDSFTANDLLRIKILLDRAIEELVPITKKT